MQRGLGLGLLDALHQLGVLGDQLPQVSHLLQQFGEEVLGVGMVGLQVELEGTQDGVLDGLHLRHVHEAWPVCGDTGQGREREEAQLEARRAGQPPTPTLVWAIWPWGQWASCLDPNPFSTKDY